jgi:hypothetical protein
MPAAAASGLQSSPFRVTAVMSSRWASRLASAVGTRPKVNTALPPAAEMFGALAGLTTWLADATAARQAAAADATASPASYLEPCYERCRQRPPASWLAAYRTTR